MVFVDPDRTLISSLGLEHLPAFVHIRQDTSVGAVAEGWNPGQWQKVAGEIARAMAWTVPDVAPPGHPVPATTPDGSPDLPVRPHAQQPSHAPHQYHTWGRSAAMLRSRTAWSDAFLAHEMTFRGLAV